VFPNAPPKPPTEGQAKDQVFASALTNATKFLDTVSPRDLPNIYETALVMPSKDDGGIIKNWLEQNTTSAPAKRYGSAANLWLSNQLYKLSGAAISEGEFGRGMRGYLPRQGDPPDLVQEKIQRRHDFINAVVGNAYANDPVGKQKFLADTINRGIQLDSVSPSKVPASNAAPASRYSTPPQGIDPKDWAHVPEADRSKFFGGN
jgi:hypothetical protein